MSDPKANHELTRKKIRFVREYMVDFNATQAYIRAGFKSKSLDGAAVGAYHLLRQPKVKQLFEELEREENLRRAADADFIVDNLKKIICNGASASAKVAAMTLLSRRTGGFVERHEVTAKPLYEDARIEILHTHTTEEPTATQAINTSELHLLCDKSKDEAIQAPPILRAGSSGDLERDRTTEPEDSNSHPPRQD